MRRRAERPEAELAKARLIIQIQGKASELLEAAGRERRPHAAAVIESSFAESEPATGTKGACLGPGSIEGEPVPTSARAARSWLVAEGDRRARVDDHDEGLEAPPTTRKVALPVPCSRRFEAPSERSTGVVDKDSGLVVLQLPRAHAS